MTYIRAKNMTDLPKNWTDGDILFAYEDGFLKACEYYDKQPGGIAEKTYIAQNEGEKWLKGYKKISRSKNHGK